MYSDENILRRGLVHGPPGPYGHYGHAMYVLLGLNAVNGHDKVISGRCSAAETPD